MLTHFLFDKLFQYIRLPVSTRNIFKQVVRAFVVQSSNIASKKYISKLFVRHSSGDKRRNEEKKIK